ncbi:MAG: glycosyltransferase family 4 protein [Bacteroidota bacterium]|nr:glycosyltransferase family 4 protein [Bacteroidota bacterium]
MPSGKTISIHIGARAHYLLPRSLASKDRLEVMITDTWIGKAWLRKLLSKAPLRIVRSFSNRYHPAIPAAAVRSFSLSFLWKEIMLRYQVKDGWQQIIARNNYFQEKALPIFLRLPNLPVLATSYTALHIFEAAAKRRQHTILFQIDPGLREEQIVAAVVAAESARYPSAWTPAPAAYWELWRKECMLADTIMVNSEWSRQGLIAEGIDAAKIKIVDLPYQVQAVHQRFQRSYPERFNAERPLRCLFLGTLTLRKGVHLALAAARELSAQPVEFIFVGQAEIDEAILKDMPNVRYQGVATREETDRFYQQADVFLFPTLSDGFGLTQLEAMAWKLPVIATTCCAPVVVHNQNGFTLSNPGTNELVAAITQVLVNPGRLKEWSARCLPTAEKYSLERFSDELAKL